MRRLILGVVGLLVLAAAVWSQAPRIARVLRKEVQLTRRELPGAALLFPAGKALQEKIDYADGRLEIQFGSTGRANLTWTTSEALTDDEFETMLVKPLQESLDVSLAERGPVKVAGNPGSRWLLRGKQIDLVVSDWTCGKRSFNLIVGGARTSPPWNSASATASNAGPTRRATARRASSAWSSTWAPTSGSTAKTRSRWCRWTRTRWWSPSTPAASLRPTPKFDEIMPLLMDGIATGAGITGTSFKTKMVERGKGGARKLWYGQGTMDGERQADAEHGRGLRQRQVPRPLHRATRPARIARRSICCSARAARRRPKRPPRSPRSRARRARAATSAAASPKSERARMRKLLVGVAGLMVLAGVVWSLAPHIRRLLPASRSRSRGARCRAPRCCFPLARQRPSRTTTGGPGGGGPAGGRPRAAGVARRSTPGARHARSRAGGADARVTRPFDQRALRDRRRRPDGHALAARRQADRHGAQHLAVRQAALQPDRRGARRRRGPGWTHP